MAELVSSILSRVEYLVTAGVPYDEAYRTVIEEFSSLLNVQQNDWRPDASIGQGEVPPIFGDFTVPWPALPVIPEEDGVPMRSPWDDAGIDGHNPDPQNPEPGYAGGRNVWDLTQYQSNAPENTVVQSEPYPYDDQNARNYVDAPFTPPAETPTVGVPGYQVAQQIPPWSYDIEQDQGGVQELDLPRDKESGQYLKDKPKHERQDDVSLAPVLDQARVEYLHTQSDGDVEMPHMVVDGPEIPDEPSMIVDKVEEAMAPDKYQKIKNFDELPPAEQKILRAERRKDIKPWLGLLGGLSAAAWYLEAPPDALVELTAKYVYTGHEYPEICESFHGKTFDLLNRNNRPVPPSEGLGYTNTHPNCKCYWDINKEPVKRINVATKKQKEHIHTINRKMGQKARHGELHKISPKGKISKKTYDTNFRLRETIAEIRQDFDWLTDDYLERVRNVGAPGQMFLINASEEAITDHRSEGEPHRRWLTPDELHAMARTATGKHMDVNHRPELQTGSEVLDSEYNAGLKQIQMIVNEQDPEILQAIQNGQITAVSINGGAPRSETIECPSCDTMGNCECFIVPKGVILGEQDNIALTWVVTDPNGIRYHGQWISPATPGVKTTAIQPL